LWVDVLKNHDLDEHETALLREAVRTIDALDLLDAEVRRNGVMTTTGDGALRVHPALVEARQLKLALARLLAAMRIPEGDDDGPGTRPQRRGASRGVYGA
jgi:hypothetical protein